MGKNLDVRDGLFARLYRDAVSAELRLGEFLISPSTLDLMGERLVWLSGKTEESLRGRLG